MRNLKVMAIGLLSFLVVGVTTVSAEVVEIKNEKELISCVATNGNTCKLMDKISTTDVIVLNNDITIDLNGYSITNATAKLKVFDVAKGKVTFTGKGVIESGSDSTSAIRIIGSTNENDANYVVVTIDKDVTVKSWGYGVFITHNNKHAYGVVVTIKGTLIGENYAAFYTNGSFQDKAKNYPVVNIDGAKLTGKTGGIYAAGYTEWNINNSVLSGEDCGIGIKSGILNVKDSKISSNGEDSTPTEGFSNGINSSGAAIQIESNTSYAGDMQINIDGGTYTSEKGVVLYEYLDSKNKDTSVASINIKNANFTSTAGKKVILTSEQFANKIAKFIESGTFSSDVTSYVKEGYSVKKVSDTSFIVGKTYTVSVKDSTNGSVVADVKEGMLDDTVTLKVVPKDGYELRELTVTDENNKTIVVTNNTFKLPASNVTITATFGKVEVKTEVPVVDTKETPKETTIGVSNSEKVTDILLDTLANSKELKDAIDGISVTTSLDIKIVTTTKLDIENATKALKDKKLSNAKIGDFFDITINVKNANTGDVIGTLPELKSDIELVVALPEDLLTVADGYTRTYYIVRNHNGVLDVLDTVLSKDKKSVSFTSDKFSTYAIAYVDTPTSNSTIASNPQTGDNIMLYVSLVLISVGGLGYMVKTKKFN